MKCSACGHVSHPGGVCNVAGCSCDENAPVPMTVAEVANLVLEGRLRTEDLRAFADVAPPGPDPGVPDDSPGPGDPVTPAAPPPGPADSALGPSGDLPAPDEPMGPHFTIPVGVIEGIKTSDGRSVRSGALVARACPLPLGFIKEYDHGGDFPAAPVVVGRIDSITRNGDDTWSAEGFMLPTDEADDAVEMIETQAVQGVSVDVGNVMSELVATEYDEDGFPIDFVDELTQGEILGFTVLPQPAFAGCYIVIDRPDQEPVQTPIVPAEAIPASAARLGIRIHNIVACNVCEDGRGAVVASAAPVAPPREWFDDPALGGAGGKVGLTVDDDGRVRGYIAQFGTCHIGIDGTCVEPYPSKTDFAYFRRGYVVCADGSTVATGPVTLGTGHASTSGRLGLSQVLAHYDNTGTAVADVAMGQDAHGIWVAGALRPDANEETVRTLRASSVSGDWRWLGGGMETVAVLACNVPGYMPKLSALAADGHLEALVAAGAAPGQQRSFKPERDPMERRLATMEAIVRGLVPTSRDAALARLDAALG